MTRYKISNNISITGLEEITEEDIPERYRTGFYLLCNQTRNREYLINETIRYFIKKFEQPKSRDEIIEEVAADVKSDRATIKKTCISFFRFLRRKKILIKEGENDTIVSEETVYKKGDLLSHYLITDILTNKRDIDVYKAIDQKSNTTCVIKLLNQAKLPESAKYNKEASYLQREYELLKKADNVPFVSKALAFDKDKDGNVYIAQEFVPGIAIARFMAQRKGLTKSNAFEVIRNMLHAFGALHTVRIVHGDVHSANVLVAEDRSVKIIDLGLSLNKEIEEDQVIKYGGVDYYMPPERINTSSTKKFIKAPDFYSDVYQIGLLIYVVIYAALPFKGFIWEELSAAIKEGAVALPDKSPMGFIVPTELKDLIRKCLAKTPEKRFSTAMEIAERFNQFSLQIDGHQLNNA